MVDTLTFEKPELGIYIKCDVHAWMEAYIHVFDHPYFAVTDEEGAFTIKDLPPGEYELTVWHEFRRFEPVEGVIKVKVNEDQTSTLECTYRVKPLGWKE